MSREPPKKVSPLWHYMSVHSPAPPPARAKTAHKPREITQDDLQPLRQDLQWRPGAILELYGPAADGGQHLPRLLAAAAILQGPHRIREATERLNTLLAQGQPRLERLLSDDTLAPRKKVLAELLQKAKAARAELSQTRARAANDATPDMIKPGGLRVLDLAILTDNLQTSIELFEVVQRRNVAGIDYAFAFAAQIPQLKVAETWLERSFGSARMKGIVLFAPPGYGRLVLAYEDGRLAYDPGARREEA